MASTSKYSYIRLEPSDNGGAILSYDEKVGEAKGPYDSCSSVCKKEVFTKDNIGEGVKKMFSMVGIMVEITKSEEEEEGESVIITVKS